MEVTIQSNITISSNLTTKAINIQRVSVNVSSLCLLNANSLKIVSARANIQQNLTVLPINSSKYKTLKADINIHCNLEGYYYEGDIKNNLMTCIPPVLSNTKTFTNLQTIQASKLTQQFANMFNLFNQFYIDSADCGLEYWENLLGIKTDTNLSNEQRRLKIKAKKILNFQTVPAKAFDTLMDAYYKCDVTEDLENSVIKIKVLGARGTPPRIKEMMEDAEEILPCHLAYEFEETFLPWSELDITKWSRIDGYTWDGLETAFLV
jgi:hypothetical protein